MSQVAVVLNPVKTTDPDALLELLQRRCIELGWPETTVHETTAEDPGGGATRDALDAGADLVLASGGDGTVRAVAAALAGTDATLAILPQGTGNLLARNLGVPVQTPEAVEVALTGTRLSIDLGELAGSPPMTFAVMAGIGFDAAMMRQAPEGLKGLIGWPAYLVGGLRGLRHRRVRVTIRLDGGEPVRQRVRTVLIGSVGRLQGGLELLPGATPDDGMLHVGVVDPRGLTGWVVLLGRVLRHADHLDRRWQTFQAKEVLVRAERSEPRQVDGELIDDGTELRASVRPGALRVCVPQDGRVASGSAQQARADPP